MKQLRIMDADDQVINVVNAAAAARQAARGNKRRRIAAKRKLIRQGILECGSPYRCGLSGTGRV